MLHAGEQHTYTTDQLQAKFLEPDDSGAVETVKLGMEVHHHTKGPGTVIDSATVDIAEKTRKNFTHEQLKSVLGEKAAAEIFLRFAINWTTPEQRLAHDKELRDLAVVPAPTLPPLPPPPSAKTNGALPAAPKVRLPATCKRMLWSVPAESTGTDVP